MPRPSQSQQAQRQRGRAGGEEESTAAGSVLSCLARWSSAISARRRRCILRARQRRKPQSPLLRRNASVKRRRAQICVPCMGHLLALYTIAIEPIATHTDEDEYAIEHQKCADCARRRIVRVGCGRSEERRVGKECRSRWSPY